MAEVGQLLTTKEVAQILNVSRGTVYKLLQSDQIKGIKLNGDTRGKWRVRVDDLSDFIARRERA